MAMGAVLALAALLARPRLWPTAARQAVLLAPRGWWRRPPYLPLPDPDYLAFRMETMYGDRSHPPEPGAVLTYLEWCREHRRALRYPSAMQVPPAPPAE
jgi:hypothetical protein